jgi:hypothetical protein
MGKQSESRAAKNSRNHGFKIEAHSYVENEQLTARK